MDPPATRPFTVLFVCTGNICRSALAERLARAYLDEALGEGDRNAVRLISGGTHAVVGSGMHPDSALVLRGLGGGAGGFRAQQLNERLPVEADLVLTMTTRHRDAVLGLVPRALLRTFLLREAGDLVRMLGSEIDLAGDTLADRARRLVGAMAAARGRRRVGLNDSVRDPVNQPLAVHQEVGEAITEALLPLLARIASLAAPADALQHGS